MWLGRRKGRELSENNVGKLDILYVWLRLRLEMLRISVLKLHLFMSEVQLAAKVRLMKIFNSMKEEGRKSSWLDAPPEGTR